MIYTDFHIRQDEWNDTTSFIRITGTPERQAFLQLTASKVQWNTKQLTAIITDKETARVEYSTEDIVSAYKRLPPCQTWFGFVRDMAAKKEKTGRQGTALSGSAKEKTWHPMLWIRKRLPNMRHG